MVKSGNTFYRSHPNPGWREKNKLNCYFHTSLFSLKMSSEDLKGLHKTFWGTTKKCENKNFTQFLFQYEFQKCMGRGRLIFIGNYLNFADGYGTVLCYNLLVAFNGRYQALKSFLLNRLHSKQYKWRIIRSSLLEVFCKKGVLRKFAKFTEKGLRPATLLKKRLWHRCFPVNFAKFQRTPFSTEHLRWLLLNNIVQNIRCNNLHLRSCGLEEDFFSIIRKTITVKWCILLWVSDGY